jgi:hypothetical protein
MSGYGFNTGFEALDRYYNAVYEIVETYYRTVAGANSELLISGLKSTVPTVNQLYASTQSLYNNQYFQDLYKNFDWGPYLKSTYFSLGDAPFDYNGILNKWGFSASAGGGAVSGGGKAKRKKKKGKKRSKLVDRGRLSLQAADADPASCDSAFKGDALINPRPQASSSRFSRAVSSSCSETAGPDLLPFALSGPLDGGLGATNGLLEAYSTTGCMEIA